MKLALVILLAVVTACAPAVRSQNSITITEMSWFSVAKQLITTQTIGVVFVHSGGGYFDEARNIISILEPLDVKVICVYQCVSAAAFVVVCGDYEWENRGELWFHSPVDINGVQSVSANQWVDDNCGLPSLSATTGSIGWSVFGNDLSNGTLRKWNK